ncbi:hypothetical protein E6W39_10335 [Kitasatospora acidiphila]|uniref:Uncharacterized protein n=1 Tax=Kitasatospora acidiphila TaxID=2567942 RepID=A0A540W0V1_9ACTN|nr:hypothetical protein [Kitasatospora acidiphila]TQF02587.1 hypothetical protein E6W39_10335 [Kitasatospora acidiphila]
MSASRRKPKLVTAAVVAVLLATVGAAVAAPASAASTAPRAARAVRSAGFNASGSWDIFQTNATVHVNIRQDSDGSLYGSASSGNTVATLQDGAVDGENIHFTLAWSQGPLGRYTGVRGADGRLSGTTVDLHNPSSQSSWFTQRTF